MSTPPSNTQFAPKPLLVGTANCKRHSITTVIDFNLGLTFSLDLSAIQDQMAWIQSIQTIFVDNGLNANPIIITTGSVLQVVRIPAYSQAYLPLLQSNPPVLQFQSAAAIQLRIQLLDFFLPPCVWGASGNTLPVDPVTGYVLVSDPVLDGTVSNGKVNVASVPLAITSLTDASGTITTGGTPQIAIPASTSRQRWVISNPSTALRTLQISFGAGAAGKIDLVPGATWDESNSTVVGDAVYVVTTTTGDPFTAYYK